jgi:hypothetical protein
MRVNESESEYDTGSEDESEIKRESECWQQ